MSKCSHSAQNAAGILMSELCHNTATSSAKHVVSKNNSCLFAITALKHSLSCRHYSRESTPNPQAPDTFSNLYEATIIIIFRRDRPATAVATHQPLVLILVLWSYKDPSQYLSLQASFFSCNVSTLIAMQTSYVRKSFAVRKQQQSYLPWLF